MKTTVQEFLNYAKNAGFEFKIDEDFSEEGHDLFMVPDRFALKVDDSFIQALDLFYENCEDEDDKNTVRIITDIEDEMYYVWPINRKFKFTLYKKVF